MSTTVTATAYLTTLRVERRDLIAAHRQLLDYGITSQTAEVHDRLTDIESVLAESAADHTATSVRAATPAE